jgi:hypothetical protein
MSVTTPQFTGENIGHALKNLTGDVTRKLAESRYKCDDTACTLIAISGTPVTDVVVDVEYGGFTVSAEGGWAPYVFSVVAGSLPPGITLDPDTGAVEGTPTEAGEFAGIVIRATDSLSTFDDLDAFAITVATE